MTQAPVEDEQVTTPATEQPIVAPYTPLSDQDIREEALNTALKREDVPTPFWPKSNGHIVLRDVSTADLLKIDDLRKRGENALYTASLLILALVNKDTGNRIFQTADMEYVAALGAGMLKPVMTQLHAFFGMDATAVADAKKN